MCSKINISQGSCTEKIKTLKTKNKISCPLRNEPCHPYLKYGPDTHAYTRYRAHNPHDNLKKRRFFLFSRLISSKECLCSKIIIKYISCRPPSSSIGSHNIIIPTYTFKPDITYFSIQPVYIVQIYINIYVYYV